MHPRTRAFKKLLERATYEQGKKFATKAAVFAGKSIYQAGKKYMTKKTSGTRSKVVRKGGRLVKTRPTSGKNKMTKKIVKLVKKEIAFNEPVGKYYKNYAGQALLPGPGSTNWKASHNIYRNVAPGDNAYLKELSFFSPRALIDAASVMFNGKTPATSPGVIGDFGDKELVVKFKYASVNVMFKNCYDFPIELNIITAQAKDLEVESFAQDWSDFYSVVNTVGTFPSFSSYGTKPGHLDGLKARYRFKDKTVILQPGDSTNIYHALPQDYLFEQTKVYDATSIQPYSPDTFQIVYRFLPLINLGINSTSDRLVTGRVFVNGDANADQNNITGMIIEVKESYIMVAPTITDVAQAKDKICYHNDYDVNTLVPTKQRAVSKLVNTTFVPRFGLTYV